MKTILVPTDFSTFSEKALDLSIVLAKATGAKIVLYHVLSGAEGKNARQKAEQAIKKLEDRVLRSGAVHCESRLEEGEVAKGILQTKKTTRADLILMGAKGAGGSGLTLLGSITDLVIRQSQCPVMVVPAQVNFSPIIKQITYATDYDQSDIKDILQLMPVASALKAQLNILHVGGDEISAEREVQLMEDFMKRINRTGKYNNLSFQMLHGNKVIETLTEFSRLGSTDLLVLATHHRHLLERAFGAGLRGTKQILPLVAFHCNAAA